MIFVLTFPGNTYTEVGPICLRVINDTSISLPLDFLEIGLRILTQLLSWLRGERKALRSQFRRA